MSQPLLKPHIENSNYDLQKIDKEESSKNTASNNGDDTHENYWICEECPFGRLPDELLLLVFSYLKLYDIKNRVALTCRRWLEVSKSKSLLNDMSFGPAQPTDVILRVLQSAPLLTRLTLYARNDVNDILRELTLSNVKLNALKITTRTECRHVEVESEVLLELLRVAKSLKYLCLKRVSLDDARLVFAELGSAAPGLVALSLNHSAQVDTSRLHRLVTSLPKLKDFRIYSISYNNIGSQTPYTDTPVVELLTRMGDSLEVLNLNMMGLTGHVMPFLATCSRLKTLHLYRATGVDDDDFVLLASLSSLRELVVTVPRAITATCFAQLLGSPTLSGLKVLNVSNSYSLDDSVLTVLAENCPGLEELSLPGCRRVTATGLSAVLTCCVRLLRLNLFSVRGASVSSAFPLIPHTTPGLRLLVYKPVDRTQAELPPELLAMSQLVIKNVYRYR